MGNPGSIISKRNPNMSNQEPPGILIYGAGAQAKIIWNAITKSGDFKVLGYLVDQDPTPGQQYLGAPVLNADAALSDRSLPRRVALGIGDNAERQKIGMKLEAAGVELPVIMHPHVSIGEMVTIGAGTVICANAMIDPDVVIGKGNILNAGSAVGHDTVTEDYVHVCGGTYVAARCRVKELSFISLRATVLPDLTVGRNCQVGAGSLLTKDLPDDHIAIGNPARFRHRAAAQ